MVYLLALALALLLIAVAAWRAFTRSAILTLEDAIVRPGETADLCAWLERGVFLFVDPDIRGEKVEFWSESGLLGAVPTDASGRAQWPVSGLPEGVHHFRARLAAESRYSSAEAHAIAAVWRPEEPVLITDIDHTIADVSSFRFLIASNDSIRAMPGAPESLRELAPRMRILYLSARDHVFLNKTRAWLRDRGFPEGPLLQRRVRFTQATPYEHKMMRLADVVARLKNIRFGVGDLPGDAKAYSNHAIRPILLSASPPPGLPDGTRTAKSWAEVAEIVKRET